MSRASLWVPLWHRSDTDPTPPPSQTTSRSFLGIRAGGGGGHPYAAQASPSKLAGTLTGVLLSEKVFMLTELLSLSEETEGGDGLLFSRGSCLCKYSRHAR